MTNEEQLLKALLNGDAKIAGMGLMSKDEKPSFSETQLEAMLMDLKQRADHYALGCPFEVGQVVTPFPDTHMKGAGIPHIVIDVNKDAPPTFMGTEPSDASSNVFGARHNMRVLTKTADGESFVAYWVESWLFKEYAQ